MAETRLSQQRQINDRQIQIHKTKMKKIIEFTGRRGMSTQGDERDAESPDNNNYFSIENKQIKQKISREIKYSKQRLQNMMERGGTSQELQHRDSAYFRANKKDVLIDHDWKKLGYVGDRKTVMDSSGMRRSIQPDVKRNSEL